MSKVTPPSVQREPRGANQCEAGCKRFSGGEVRHHKYCVHYPESFSKMYDELRLDKKELLEMLEKVSYQLDEEYQSEIESLIQKHKQ